MELEHPNRRLDLADQGFVTWYTDVSEMGKKGSSKKEDAERRPRDFRVRPFEELRSLKKKHPSASKSPTPSQQKSSSPAPATEQEEPSALNEAQTFAEAMSNVVPLEARERVSKKKVPGSPPRSRTVDEAAAVDAYLRDLVDGVVPFDIADTDEYIEGSVQGFDHHVARKLRRGEFSIEGHIDLHGLRREEARAAVAKFIKDAHAHGKRCVLIVHGRGLRSKGQIPVLKEKLKAWLTRGSIGTKVLAFASARPYDGGTGAVYVLLRR